MSLAPRQQNILELVRERGSVSIDELARQKGQYARIKSGKVLRVERNNMLVSANIGLAVQFSG